MEDIASTKGGPIVDKYKDGIKRKRPGRDKESRMKDLSDNESSGDSDSSVEKASPVKSSKGQAAKSDLKSKESKLSKDTSKLKGKESSSKRRSSDKHKKQKRNKDRRPRDSSESNSGSSDSSFQTREAKRESRKKEKKLRESIIKRMMDKMKGSPASIKVSIERKKYETSAKVDETLKKSSTDFKSTVEFSLGPKSRDDPNKIESQGEVHNRKDKCRTSNYDVEKEIKSKKIINDSIPEHGKRSPQKKIIKEGQKDQSQMESTKMHNVPDKFNEKQDKSNDKKGKQPQSHGNLSEASSSSSESIDADSHTQEQSSKEKNSKADKSKDLLIEGECKIVGVNVPQAETNLDIKKDSPNEKEIKREKSASRSSSRSNDSSPKESNDKSIDVDNKDSIKVERKYNGPYLGANRKVNERERKSTRSSDSSNSSSDSESSVSKGKYTHISRDNKRGRGIEKNRKKDKTRAKRMPTKDNTGKFNRKGHGSGRRNKRRGSSVSSTSSSSSKTFSDSSSSTSGSSSSSSRSSSVSKDRSSSSTSSSSSSSIRRRHKRSYKTKESAKHRSRSPLNIRKKSNEPPRPKKIHVGHLSKNINKMHLYEIFSLYGIVKNIDLPLDRSNGHTSRGFAYVEYNHASDADKALRHMDGGIIDGQKIAIAPVLLCKPRPIPVRRISPNRPRPFVNWRYTTPFRNRGGGAMMNSGGRDHRRRMRSPPRRRSPRRRTRSRSPNRRHRMRHRSLSSSR